MNATIKYEYGHFRGVKRCEVKRRAPQGGYTWLPGDIAELSGKGAFVVLDAGGRNFFYFSEMRPLADTALDTVKPRAVMVGVRLATIGDAVAAKPQAQAAPRPVAVAPPPKPAAPALPLPPTPPPAPVKAPRKQQKRRHIATAIGDMFRGYRLSEAVTQKTLADLLSCSATRMSGIECGDLFPDDGELERFASISGHELAKLKALRDGEPEQEEADQTPPSVVEEPEIEEAAAAPAPPVQQATPQVEQAAAGFDDFMDRLCDLAPLPVDKDARRRWLQLARELHGLSRA